MPIFFHIESINFSFNKRNLYKKWIKSVLEFHGLIAGSINVIFTSNDYLLRINQEYLNHNFFTDVITFNYNEEKRISGDIFVSIEQVQINSAEYGVVFENEIARVIIHGLLHLCGYNDSSENQKESMKKEEDRALVLLKRLKNGESL